MRIKQPKLHKVMPMLLLVMGGVMIPGGYMLSGVIQNVVANSIDTALLGIEDQGIPLVKGMVKELGTPEALRGIRDQGVPAVKEIVKHTGGAEVLSRINDTAIPIVVDMVKQIGCAEVLNQINGTAIPIVVDTVKQLGCAEVMNKIKVTAIPIVIDKVKQVGVAEVLSRISDQAVPFTEVIVNATFLTKILYEAYVTATQQTIIGIEMGDMGGDVLLSIFFDRHQAAIMGGIMTYVFSEQLAENNMPAIKGYGEWHYEKYGEDPLIGHWGSLDLTPTPNYILAWGDPENDGSITPGFIQDSELGTGVLAFLDEVAAAKGNAAKEAALCARYLQDSGDPVEFWQLSRLADYYYQYWVPTAIPLIVGALADSSSMAWEKMPQYRNMNTKQIAMAEFLAQWANRSRYPEGMDFHQVEESINESTYGLEIAETSTGITLPTALALWDDTNPLGLTNMDAMATWYAANSTDAPGIAAWNQIYEAFNLGDLELNSTQLNQILTWLWHGDKSFSQFIVPTLIRSPAGYNMEIEDLAQILFMEQWTNGTFLNKVMYANGLNFGEMMPGAGIHDPTTGWEVATIINGVNSPTGITAKDCADLWDPANDNSLFNEKGINVWYAANGTGQDAVNAIKALKTAFPGLSDIQRNKILTWLWGGEDSFSQKMVPTLINSSAGYSMTIDAYALQLFMEQWANGTIRGKVMYPGGLNFGEMMPGAGIPDPTTGWEVATFTGDDPNPTCITLEVCKGLWDKNSDYALFSETGIKEWYAANGTGVAANDARSAILTAFPGLSPEQMGLILAWLWGGEDSFSQKMVPTLINSAAGYNMPIESYAQMLFMEQWANGTIRGVVMYPGGLDFSTMMDGFSSVTTGFEIGNQYPADPFSTGITYESCKRLWDKTNDKSLFNMDGMGLWYEGNGSETIQTELADIFDLTDLQVDQILQWLYGGENSFSQKLLVTLIESPAGYSMQIDDFAMSLLLEQWANGTVLGDVMFDGGIDFSTIVPMEESLFGFEVGVPTASGITYESGLNLFDDANNWSLTNDDGIKHWLAAMKGNETEKAELVSKFSLTEGQVDMILIWIGTFKETVVPALMELPIESGGRGMNLDTLAKKMLLEQWTNGTADGRSIYPNGFPLPLGDVIAYGFEIGYQGQDLPVIKTGITYESALALWDTGSETSLANKAGLKKWWEAVNNPDSAVADELQVANGLTDEQMGMVLKWLPTFTINTMPALAKYQYNLPLDTTQLCAIMPVGGFVIGAVSLVSGSMMVKKNRTIKRSRSINLVAFEKANEGLKHYKGYRAAAYITPVTIGAPANPEQPTTPGGVPPDQAKVAQDAETLKQKATQPNQEQNIVDRSKLELSQEEKNKIKDAAKAKLEQLHQGN